MKEFKETEFYQELDATITQYVRHDLEFTFGSYSDNIFTYTYDIESDGLYTSVEVSFICNDTLFILMTTEELLDLKKVKYFSLRVFERVPGARSSEVVEDLDWRFGDE
jgi:hypothetical protein